MIHFQHISQQLGKLPKQLNLNEPKPFTSTAIRMSRQERYALIIEAIRAGATSLPQVAKAIDMSTSHLKLLLKELADVGAIEREAIKVCGASIVYKYSPIHITNEKI